MCGHFGLTGSGTSESTTFVPLRYILCMTLVYMCGHFGLTVLLEYNIVCTAIELTLQYGLLYSLPYTEFLDTFDKQRDTEKVCSVMTKMFLLQLFVLFVCLFVCCCCCFSL